MESSISGNLALIRANAASLGAVWPSSAYDGPENLQASGSFGQRVQDAVQSVNQQDDAAARQMAAVDSGQSDDLVGAMLASQQASLSFSMLMQVRNKVVAAVEDLVKLPL